MLAVVLVGQPPSRHLQGVFRCSGDLYFCKKLNSALVVFAKSLENTKYSFLCLQFVESLFKG